MLDEHRKFLNALKESGTVNMFGAAPHLVLAFGLTRREAKAVLVEWMTSYGELEEEDHA